ncbi:hypothetical protein MACJ_000254 [Theileria orientalis]|uniref:50S ribosomal protein L10 n=1 Tax=Theileria orientalis TaxID=68886 RepID=A0A976QR79_THEOR|nr:hypothetical protein MACJ_000254 [Theileria orientalis]
MCNLFFVLYNLFYVTSIKYRVESYVISTPVKYHQYSLGPINYRYIIERRNPKNAISFRAGKVKLIKGLKEQLEGTKALFQFRLFRMTHPIRQYIKDNLLKDIHPLEDGRLPFKLQVVKNSLMRIALRGTEYEIFTPKVEKTNLYIFIYDDSIVPKLMSLINGFRKASKLIKWRFEPSFGCFCGRVINSLQMRSLSSLITKKDLIARMLPILRIQPARLVNSLNVSSRLLNSISYTLHRLNSTLKQIK